MDFQTNIKLHAVLKGMPYDSSWERTNKETGITTRGETEKIKAVLIPENSKVSSSSLKEIELNAYSDKVFKMAIKTKDITAIWFRNEEAFAKGEKHVVLDLKILPTFNQSGVIYGHSSRLYNISVVYTKEEDKPLLDLVLKREADF